MNILILLISVILGSLGQVLLKLGAGKLGNVSLALLTAPSEIIRIFKIPEIILGIALFVVSMLLWIKVLTRMELSYAYPMVSLGYINVTVLSYFLFHESFSLMKLVGIAVIILGVALLNFSV